MDKKLNVSVSPHIHSGNSTTKVMLDVIIALLPATIAGIVIFGWRALLLVAVCIGTSVLCEYDFNKIIKKDNTIGDLSAVVTGLILALNLPVNAPLWQAAIGSAFAIIIVKCLFGGIGKNVVNPAATARVFMLIAFSSLATPAFPKDLDAVSSATPLSTLGSGTAVEITDLLFGNVGGTIGETCKIAILIGFLYLLIKRVISWHIPVAVIGSAFLFTLALVDGNASLALSWILSGGLVFGAVFMATDYTTSPSTSLGKIIFGIGCGLITVLIRQWGNYPEGVSFAILLMNIFNPYIDTLTARKLFGGAKK